MAFIKGNKVRINAQPDAYEVVAGPDTGKNYCVQNASGRLLIRPALDLSPLPRTLAEVDPGVACRVAHSGPNAVHYRDVDGRVYHFLRYDRCFAPQLVSTTHADELVISAVLGPVKTVVEGRE